MDSAELVKLKQQLATVQFLLQHYAVWLESEHDPVKISDYKLHIEFGKNRERSFTAKIARHYLADKIRELEQALSSSDIDNAGSVEFIERIRRFPSLDNSLPPSISQRQYLEERREAARIEMDVLDAEIFECDRDFPEWKKRLDALLGYETDETRKKPEPEVVEPAPLPTTPGESDGARTPTAPDEPKQKKSPASGPIPDLVQKATPGTRKSGKKTKKSQDARSTSLFESEFDQAVAKLLRKNPDMEALDVYVYFDARLRIELPPEMKTKPGDQRSWVSAYRCSDSQRHALTERVSSVRRRLGKARN